MRIAGVPPALSAQREYWNRGLLFENRVAENHELRILEETRSAAGELGDTWIRLVVRTSLSIDSARLARRIQTNASD